MAGSVPPARHHRTPNRKTRKRAPKVSLGIQGRRWVIEVRQSKKRYDGAGDATTTSINIQQDACRRAIASIDPKPTVVEVVVDHGISGGPFQNRPGRDRLLSLVDAGRADAVMAYTADRIGRDVEESEHLWNRCVEAGALVCATDCLDLSDAMMRAVYFGRAQKDNEARSDYALAIIDKRRGAGNPPIKTGAPFGMRWKGDTPVPVPREFSIVEETLARFADGETMGAIARDYTGRRLRRARGPTGWSSAHISRILYCTWYVGLIPDGKHPDGTDRYWDFDDCCVDRELWDRVQLKLGQAHVTGLRKAHSLSGLLFCGVCEGWSAMTLCASRKTNNDGAVVNRWRYRCAHRRVHKDLCPGVSIDAERTERLILPNLLALLGDGDVARQRFGRRVRAQAEHADARLQALSTRMSDLEARRSKLLDKYLQGLVPEDLYDQRMPALERAATEVRVQRQRLLAGTTLSAAALGELQRDLSAGGPLTAGRWFGLSPAKRSDFLHLAFPNGLFVLPKPQDTTRGSVERRIALRHADAAADAQARYRSSLDGDSP